MANKVSPNPNLPSPVVLSKFQDVQSFLTQLVQSTVNELRSHALRLNAAFTEDGLEAVGVFAKAALPPPILGGVITVTDDTGGTVLAFGDGTHWRRVTDRAVIS